MHDITKREKKEQYMIVKTTTVHFMLLPIADDL